MPRTGFSYLSEELVLLIEQYLDFGSLIALSSTTRTLRNLFIPRVFRGLRLTNDEAAATIVGGLAEKYSEHVRHLRFEARIKDDRLPNFTLSNTARRLLQGDLLPLVTSLVVHSGVEVPPYAPTESSLEEDPTPVDWQRQKVTAVCMRAEQAARKVRHPKRYLVMMEPWQSIAENSNIRSLEIDQLLPIRSAAFSRAQFKRFLGRLTNFRVNVAAARNTSHKLALMRAMGRLFIRHLVSLEELHISFPAELDYQASLHFNEAWHDVDELPRLRSITAQNMLVAENLCDFICLRAKALEALHFDGCVDSGALSLHNWRDGFVGIWSPWSYIFKSIRESEPILRSLTVTPQNAWDPEVITAWIDPDDNQARCCEWVDPCKHRSADIRERLANDPSLRVFGHYDVEDDPSGKKISGGQLCSMWGFRRMEVQEEYELLMELVHRNAAKFEKINPADDPVRIPRQRDPDHQWDLWYETRVLEGNPPW